VADEQMATWGGGPDQTAIVRKFETLNSSSRNEAFAPKPVRPEPRKFVASEQLKVAVDPPRALSEPAPQLAPATPVPLSLATAALPGPGKPRPSDFVPPPDKTSPGQAGAGHSHPGSCAQFKNGNGPAFDGDCGFGAGTCQEYPAARRRAVAAFFCGAGE
jgi:hypothetical protein